MATSTFGKEFRVEPEKANGFVHEMTRKVTPTLRKDFKSKFTHEEELQDVLRKALKQLKDYVVVPLGEIIDKEYDCQKIEYAFKKFSCRREEDLENFLVQKAITYQKAEYGKTYLFLDKEKLDDGEFVIMAYFTIAHRAVDISDMSLSKRRKVLGEHPGRECIKSVSAFLIGQLGRCDDYTNDDLSGEQILDECYHAISMAAKLIGGKLLVLECREHMFSKFYEMQKFKKLYDKLNEEGLYTLYKKIDFSEYWRYH